MKDFSIQKKYYPGQNYSSPGNQNNYQKYYTPITNKSLNLNQSNSFINYNRQRYQSIINKNKTPYKSQTKQPFQSSFYQPKNIINDYSKDCYQSTNQKNMITNLRQELNSLKSQVNKLIQKDPQSALKSQFNPPKQFQTHNLKQNIQKDKLNLFYISNKGNEQIFQRRQSEPVQSHFLSSQQRQSLYITKPTNQIAYSHSQNKIYNHRSDSLKEKQVAQNKAVQLNQKQNQRNQIFKKHNQNIKQSENYQTPNNFLICQKTNNANQSKIYGSQSKNYVNQSKNYVNQYKNNSINQHKNSECLKCSEYIKQILFFKQKVQKNSLPDHYLQQIQHQQTKMKKMVQNYQLKCYNLQKSNKDLSDKIKQQQQKNKELKEKNEKIGEQLQDSKRMIEQVRLSVSLKNSLLDKFEIQIQQLKNTKINLSNKIEELHTKQKEFQHRFLQFQKIRQKVSQLQSNQRRLLKDSEFWKSEYQQSNNNLNLIRVQIKNLQSKRFFSEQQINNLNSTYKRILNNQSLNKFQHANEEKEEEKEEEGEQNNLLLNEIKQNLQIYQNQIEDLKSENKSLKQEIEKISKEDKNKSEFKIEKETKEIKDAKEIKDNTNQKALQSEIIAKQKLIHNLYRDLQHFQNQLKITLCLKNNYEILINQLNNKQLQINLAKLNQRFKEDMKEQII